jgi:hypothetical protein
MADLTSCLTLAIVQSFLQRLIDFPLTDIALAERLRICTPVRYGKSKRSRHSILFSLFHFPQLLFPLFALFCCYFLGRLMRIVGLGIPIEILAFLPASNRCHERMAEIVFALRIAFDVVPFEINAAARAFLADSLKEIHSNRPPLGVIVAAERFV